MKEATKKKKQEQEMQVAEITIKPLKLGEMTLTLSNESPYMQHRFSQKMQKKIEKKHEQGQQSKKDKFKEARDFNEDFLQAMYVMEDGSYGIPAAAFRSACIRACRLVGYEMTMARCSIFIKEDGYDKHDSTALVRLTGDPEMSVMAVRNSTGVLDLRSRPMWKKWSVQLRVKFDLDQFSPNDVVNLINRAGMQVGIGEGRPFSKKSDGMGFGLFSVKAVTDER